MHPPAINRVQHDVDDQTDTEQPRFLRHAQPGIDRDGRCGVQRVEPDAAAMQLVSMDEEAAASILAKLDPRNSSAILNEMQPAKGARLAATLVGAARMAQKERAAPNAPGPAPDGAPRPNADRGGL